MSIKDIKTNLTKSLKKTTFKIKKFSPEILVVVGVVGVVVSAVMACKATTKINDVLKSSKDDIDTIHRCIEENADNEEIYSNTDSKKDLVKVYAKTAYEFTKLYAPSVILGALSLTSMLASNNILRQRNIALAAAYATVDKGFKEYRARVVNRFGEKVDKELRYDIKAKEIEETIVDPKTGKEKKVKKTIEVSNVSSHSDYARFFDVGNPYWEDDSDYNMFFLNKSQSHANNILKIDGILFLNDVYEMLGIEKSKAGQIVGWVYKEGQTNGDGFVDFGITNLYKQDRDNYFDEAILLDFNVDGNVYDLMEA